MRKKKIQQMPPIDFGDLYGLSQQPYAKGLPFSAREGNAQGIAGENARTVPFSGERKTKKQRKKAAIGQTGGLSAEKGGGVKRENGGKKAKAGKAADARKKDQALDKPRKEEEKYGIRDFFGWNEKKHDPPPILQNQTGAHTHVFRAVKASGASLPTRKGPYQHGQKDETGFSAIKAKMETAGSLTLIQTMKKKSRDKKESFAFTKEMAAVSLPSKKKQKENRQKKAKSRQARGLFAAAFLITTALFLSFCAMYVADSNTKSTGGIMEEETVFAFSASEQALDVTLLNQEVSIDISWLMKTSLAVKDYAVLVWRCTVQSAEILGEKSAAFFEMAGAAAKDAAYVARSVFLALIGIFRT